MERLIPKHKIIITLEDNEVADEELISILEGILEHGSLLAAADRLGIPYSKAWEYVRRVERILGKPLIITHRGRRGAVLTGEAVHLIEVYKRERRRLERCMGSGEPAGDPGITIDIAYSHDPILETILSDARMKSACTGSLRALAMLALGVTKIACSHLYERGEKTDTSFLEKLGIEEYSILGGYWRQLALAYNPRIRAPDSVEAMLKEALQGRLTVATRNRGSATRLLLDELLETTAEKHGIGLDKSAIRGYNRVYRRHEDVARAIASGEADIGLTLTYTATLYGLPIIPVRWKRYECYAAINDETAARFALLLNSRKTRETIASSPGYSLEQPFK